jgi:ribose 5-phosphate isomerase A
MAPDRATARLPQPLTPPLSDADLAPETIAQRKQAAARAAAELVVDGMALGLGTGSTVAFLLTALGERASELTRTRCVATSPETAQIARELGLHVGELDEVGELDLAIDGADQVDPDCWLIKGGGGAHTREKIVACAARRFVVIVSVEKLVSRLTPPIPLEVLRFGAQRTLAELGDARLRDVIERDTGQTGESARTRETEGDQEIGNRQTTDRQAAVSPDGNLLAWYDGHFEDASLLAARLGQTPGVVEHGLFAPELISEVLIAGGDGVTRRAGGKPAA